MQIARVIIDNRIINSLKTNRLIIHSLRISRLIINSLRISRLITRRLTLLANSVREVKSNVFRVVGWAIEATNATLITQESNQKSEIELLLPREPQTHQRQFQRQFQHQFQCQDRLNP